MKSIVTWMLIAITLSQVGCAAVAGGVVGGVVGHEIAEEEDDDDN